MIAVEKHSQWEIQEATAVVEVAVEVPVVAEAMILGLQLLLTGIEVAIPLAVVVGPMVVVVVLVLLVPGAVVIKVPHKDMPAVVRYKAASPSKVQMVTLALLVGLSVPKHLLLRHLQTNKRPRIVTIHRLDLALGVKASRLQQCLLQSQRPSKKKKPKPRQ